MFQSSAFQTVVRVPLVVSGRTHVLYCDGGKRTYFVPLERYAYMFCTVTVAGVRVLYCNSGRSTCFVLQLW
jgi:hypothetical protein